MLKKIKYLFTHHPSAIGDSKDVFFAEPFSHEFLKYKNTIEQFNSIKINTPFVKTRSELEKFNKEVFFRYEKILDKIYPLMNRLNNRNYGLEFWKMVFSLSLVRHITLTYYVFNQVKSSYRPNEHQVAILAEDCYFVPDDFGFTGHRLYFQYTSMGLEQLFAVYMSCFHANEVSTYNAEQFKRSISNSSSPQSKNTVFSKLRKITFKRLFFKLLSMRKKRLGILNSYFSQKNIEDLVLKSVGRIGVLDWGVDLPHVDVQLVKRKQEFLNIKFEDDFERYFFSTLVHSMPKILVENFEYFETKIIEKIKQQKLKCIVSEAWIGDTQTSFALALAKNNKIKIVGNEHNYLSHQFLCNNLNYIHKLCDEYLTIGWKPIEKNNILKSASCYEWNLNYRTRPENLPPKILFISANPGPIYPEFNASYGDTGHVNAIRFFDFNCKFFETINKQVKSVLIFKGYPNPPQEIDLLYDEKFYYKKYFQDFLEVVDNNKPAKSYIHDSSLLIVNYLSTSYIECLLSNKPVIFFWIQDNYYLNDAYGDFFNKLIAANICFTNASSAASFINNLIETNSIHQWWNSTPVQKARDEFLAENIGKPKDLINYLLNKSR